MISLDALRAELHDWCETLCVEEHGDVGYRMGTSGAVNLLSTTDIAWLRYATCDLEDLDATRREKWVRGIQNQQHKDDGRYQYTEAVGEGNMHSNGHAFWHANRALGILGSEIRIFPEYLRHAMTASGLEKWFAAWEAQPVRTHHDILGLIPILANTDDTDWVGLFYQQLAQQQDPETGTWPRGATTNISRTFAYSAIFRATNRIPPQPEKIIDAMLRLQSEDGFWRERNHSFFSTMDAIYLLVRLPRLLGYREQEAMAALERIKSPMIALYLRKEDELLGNTHSMLAVVHAIGLLSEAFPGDFSASEPWRFDWDKPELFRCELLRQELRRRTP
jgi:hypothetical protein